MVPVFLLRFLNYTWFLIWKFSMNCFRTFSIFYSARSAKIFVFWTSLYNFVKENQLFWWFCWTWFSKSEKKSCIDQHRPFHLYMKSCLFILNKNTAWISLLSACLSLVGLEWWFTCSLANQCNSSNLSPPIALFGPLSRGGQVRGFGAHTSDCHRGAPKWWKTPQNTS